MFSWKSGNRTLTKDHIANMMEDYANNPSVPLVILANKYGVTETTVTRYITEVLFGGPRPKDPVCIVLQSKINEDNF